MSRASRIVVADSGSIVRLGLKSLFSTSKELKTIEEAHDRASLMRAVSAIKPDLVVADLFLPEFSGVDDIGAVRNQHADTKVLVYTVYDEVLFAERAVRAGAAGYVMKREPTSTLVKAVRHIVKGGIFVSPRATGNLLRQMAGRHGHREARFQPLSNRELEVLRRMGEGYTSREMAHAMHVSMKTVEAHREHIKAKLGLGTGSSLLRLAIQWAQTARK